MNSSDETYDHIGQQPILVRGVAYTNGSQIVASPEEMKFFLQIGAVQKAATVPTPADPEDEE